MPFFGGLAWTGSVCQGGERRILASVGWHGANVSGSQSKYKPRALEHACSVPFFPTSCDYIGAIGARGNVPASSAGLEAENKI